MHVNIGGTGLQGTSTFLDQNAHVDANPENYEDQTIRTFRLDNIVEQLELSERLNFIKIDTEGFDTFVLEGGLEIIKKHNPAIIVEAHSIRLRQSGKSWQWYLDTFPEYHILIIYPLNRAKPYLHLEPLVADQAEISVNLLLLPKNNVVVPDLNS